MHNKMDRSGIVRGRADVGRYHRRSHRTSIITAVVAALAATASSAWSPAQAASPVTAQVAPADAGDPIELGLFTTEGDRVHVSRTPPPTASAHGWWTLKPGNSGPVKAIVTIKLQINRHDRWDYVGVIGQKTVYPGGGSANRAVARMPCKNATPAQWRSVIDVDIVDYADSPDTRTTDTVLLPCSV